MLKAAHRYTLWDFTCLKLCMLTLGIIIGAYFSAFFMNWIFIVCSIFVLSWLWLVYKTFMK
jgi:small multidrug resistance family-3 protein